MALDYRDHVQSFSRSISNNGNQTVPWSEPRQSRSDFGYQQHNASVQTPLASTHSRQVAAFSSGGAASHRGLGSETSTPFQSRPPSAREIKTIARHPDGGVNGRGAQTSKQLNKVTERIAIYSTDLKNEARLKRDAEDRRLSMLREQVLKCEKDLLDECELRQEADRMVENKLTNHVHALEKNMRDSSQRLVAMVEPFAPRFKVIEQAVQQENAARRNAIEEVREDLREAIAMISATAARKASMGSANGQGTGAQDHSVDKGSSVAEQKESVANMEEQISQLKQRMSDLQKELSEEKNARSTERRQLEDVIRSVTQPSLDTIHRLRASMEEEFNQKLDAAVLNIEARISADKAAAEAKEAAAHSSFMLELDKRARMQLEAGSSMESNILAEIGALQAAASEERRRREKAEEDIITNLGDAILSMRVV